MKRSHEQISKGDKGARHKNREKEPFSIDHEQWIRDISSQLKEERARNQKHTGSIDNTEGKPSRLNEDQIAMIYNLCRDRIPFEHIESIMGVPEGKVDFGEFERVMVEATFLIRKEEKWEGRSTSETFQGQVKTQR